MRTASSSPSLIGSSARPWTSGTTRVPGRSAAASRSSVSAATAASR
ncbi:hypothetical protein KCH_55340 [Kitasatospora cheerisanensis KCTC 2395]|uniref:Uncharacterized protein n=1 Tax=Kitasatospora cheerisanensis KCTC 2395 TaxID=1348663 RepID=A0A066YRJ8_9ACTN|nr:hypothetical protein KCH_55340 [Kitasatospora cheerisanensis KCTC 2395]